MLLLYNLFVRGYVFAIRIASLWNPKARQWMKGRKNWREELLNNIHPGDRIVWLHCASAGEFEQGKPVIEELKKAYPQYKILVSFFSPSGYTSGKKYQHADFISYLPEDNARNARQFLDLVQPELVVFVKYEYWYHHLAAIAFRHIPLLMISAIYRKEQIFFSWYGRFYRRMLFLFRHIFVQDEDSLRLLQMKGIRHCSVSGDTRFDRVKKIADHFTAVPLLSEFISGSRSIVAGSTWAPDEALLAAYIKTVPVKLVIAPHEIRKEHILNMQQQFPACVLYSEIIQILQPAEGNTNSIWNSINEEQSKALRDKLSKARTLIVDTMGVLSRLYHYATVTYVGGGFKAGIHNTLEAIVYSKPVVFGPEYHKFREARDLIREGAAFSINNERELATILNHLFDDPEALAKAAKAASDYITANTGSTQKILRYIQENRLLTS